VKEGQRISRGQVVAVLTCDDLDSQARALDASLESARQSKVRLLRGSRDEERRVADQEVKAAEAIVDQARRQNDRMQGLAAKDDVPRLTAENAKRDLDTAEAALRASVEKQKLANAGALPEEISKADAEILAAQERLHAAGAQRDKCDVRSPIDGTVTRVHLRAGEAFSTVLPRPIITVADLSERRVRAEVDERDLGKIHVKQRVRITADGFAEHFGGRVSWTSVVMGRKTARSTDPAEKSDRDILEALIVPDRGTPQLPIGLRVVVEFVAE
jgi:HlyD family secretion protein